MKEIKITPPEGYEIDKDNSTFEKIVFKEIKKELPKRWEDIRLISGYKTSEHCQIKYFISNYSHNAEYYGNVFFSKEQAEASIALAQLSQLRKVYRQGWKPDWNDNKPKFVIEKFKNNYKVNTFMSYNHFLTFQTREITELFLDNFRDLIEEASPLLFD